MVVDGTCVKVLAWSDNEIGYVNRMIYLSHRRPAPNTFSSSYGVVTSS
jgi:glyceraldehyde-3-phosphate dehydrogenase/erythrose-4-phosphate dehydrogenase